MLDFCNAQKTGASLSFFLSIVFTVDTKIRKEFYLMIYFVIFGGGKGILTRIYVYYVFMEVREIYCFGFRRGSR